MKLRILVAASTIALASGAASSASPAPTNCEALVNTMMSAFELGSQYNKEKGEKIIAEAKKYRETHSACDTLAYLKQLNSK